MTYDLKVKCTTTAPPVPKECTTRQWRIRGKDCYIDLEKFLESIERKFNIDLSKAPKCNDAIRRVFETALQQQRLIHKKDQRERDLINKLLIEFYRPSPFQLTEHLVRTSQKWERIKTNLKSKQYDALVSFGTSETTIDEETNIFDKNTAREENSLSTLLNVPPNTEVSRQEIQNEPEEISEKEEEENVEDHLPPKIVTNIYKFISPLTSNECIKLIKKEKQLLIMTEILPNPIQLDPILLDMSCTPNVHGFHRSYFTISNSQRKYPVTVQDLLIATLPIVSRAVFIAMRQARVRRDRLDIDTFAGCRFLLFASAAFTLRSYRQRS
ncbi:hypothetical protein EVAR_81104_1 [Eumeta japonica]|uniref:Uncharacterized protein n=1 Tax=Eumeta variegata TaxID=151549 RepID=A0A4C1T5Q5_EUMVA|nr:hypothetical protein EVAR_81104_1 [Eumeta japonica]